MARTKQVSIQSDIVLLLLLLLLLMMMMMMFLLSVLLCLTAAPLLSLLVPLLSNRLLGCPVVGKPRANN